MQENKKYCTVIEVASVMEYNLCDFIFYFAAAKVKTPNGNIQHRGILFLTIEEANTVKQGDKFVM